MKILITGGAGFIGSHLVERLMYNNEITVIDNFDTFYSKESKIRNIKNFNSNVKFLELDILNKEELNKLETQDVIIHLAAKAGVRQSILYPIDYQEVNVNGTQNMLEFARKKNVQKFIFASSSSVYGTNSNVPWLESDTDLQPISPYASTKISGELLGRVYSKVFNIQFISLRFFTVFGPRQRPDLAIYDFIRKIYNGDPIVMFGDGTSSRDYTYIDDIIDGICNSIDYSGSQYEVFNLGSGLSISLTEMIQTLGDVLGKNPLIKIDEMQMGDVLTTFANIDKSRNLIGYNPATSFKDGIIHFKNWILKE